MQRENVIKTLTVRTGWKTDNLKGKSTKDLQRWLRMIKYIDDNLPHGYTFKDFERDIQLMALKWSKSKDIVAMLMGLYASKGCSKEEALVLASLYNVEDDGVPKLVQHFRGKDKGETNKDKPKKKAKKWVTIDSSGDVPIVTGFKRNESGSVHSTTVESDELNEYLPRKRTRQDIIDQEIEASKKIKWNDFDNDL